MGNCFGSPTSSPATPVRNTPQKSPRVERKPPPAAVSPTRSSPANREVLLQAAEKRLKEQQLRGIPSGGK